jgi:hypothetical protein
MRITSDGNLLVNTTTDAGFKLDVNGTGRFSGLITGQSSIYQTNAAGSIASNRWETYNGGATQMFFGFPASGSVAFNNGTDKFTISNTGAATFSSSVSTSNEYYVSGTGQNAFKINSTGTYYGMIQNTAGDKWSLAYGVNGAGNTALGTSVLTWTGSGNVLIGTTTNGSSKLRLVGLPTSSAGLSSGDVYNLAGALMIA